MCLVEDECFRAGQDLAEALLLGGEVGKQQVVVDDDQIRVLRLAPRLEDEAVAMERAIDPEAVLACRRDAWPQRR